MQWFLSRRGLSQRWLWVTGMAWGVILASFTVCIAPVLAQRIRNIPEKAEQIYELVPNLPGNGEDERWLQRVLLYHVRTKGRLADSRLDWRLTFADFLEANEPMYADQYPPGNTEVNPLNDDRERFQAMTRQDRNQFLAAILEVYGNRSVTNSLELAGHSSEVEAAPVDE